MLTYSSTIVSFTLPLIHPPTYDSNTHSVSQPTPTELNYLYTYLPLPSSTSQTHALAAMRELVWDSGTLEDALIWGLGVGGGGIWASLRSWCWP